MSVDYFLLKSGNIRDQIPKEFAVILPFLCRRIFHQFHLLQTAKLPENRQILWQWHLHTIQNHLPRFEYFFAETNGLTMAKPLFRNRPRYSVREWIYFE